MTDLARDVVQRGYAALNLEYRRVGSPTWKERRQYLIVEPLQSSAVFSLQDARMPTPL